MKNQMILQAGQVLFHQLQNQPERTTRRRAVGNALSSVGLGLTLTTNLRELIVVAYDNNAADRDQFVQEWRRLVLHEKGRWYEFRLGIRPVQMGVN